MEERTMMYLMMGFQEYSYQVRESGGDERRERQKYREREAEKEVEIEGKGEGETGRYREAGRDWERD